MEINELLQPCLDLPALDVDSILCWMRTDDKRISDRAGGEKSKRMEGVKKIEPFHHRCDRQWISLEMHTRRKTEMDKRSGWRWWGTTHHPVPGSFLAPSPGSSELIDRATRTHYVSITTLRWSHPIVQRSDLGFLFPFSGWPGLGNQNFKNNAKCPKETWESEPPAVNEPVARRRFSRWDEATSDRNLKPHSTLRFTTVILLRLNNLKILVKKFPTS